jgi:prephenate dehydratase
VLAASRPSSRPTSATLGALVYYIDLETEEMQGAYLNELVSTWMAAP